MKKIWSNKSIPSGEYAYTFTQRPDKAMSLRERLFAWFLNIEPQYEDDDEPQVEPVINQERDSLPRIGQSRRKAVQQALNEWKAATSYFESVADPALVDYAVYEMEAAQKRYIYLLSSAKASQERRSREYLSEKLHTT